MKQMLVHAEPGAMQMALLDHEKLVEYAVERADGSGIVGSFFKGRVTNVIPGMQAAFIDIGQKKNAFLYVDDLLPPHLEKQPKVKPLIAELLTVGQQVTVQVIKDAMGTKGARVTTHFLLPGRFIVYMPSAGYIAISKKIERESERTRLKKLGEQLCHEEEGLIFRTVVDGQNTEAIQDDLAMLRKQWANIQLQATSGIAPSLLHRDLSMVQRLLRDVFSPSTDELIMDSSEQAEEASQFLDQFHSENRPAIRIHPPGISLFEAYGVQKQLDKAFQRKVWLESGGYLIWDQTEALHVVDVNTGKFVGSGSLEDTVFQTNLQAAEEIARLLRLRDIGGIIIIDFIDMDMDEHRHQVLNRLQFCMKDDRTQHHILGWTKLGLMELTRKKMRESTEHKFHPMLK